MKYRLKNSKQTKALEGLNYESVWVFSVIKCRYQIKARLCRSSVWKLSPIKTMKIYKHFTSMFLLPLPQRKTHLLPFQSLAVAKIVEIKIGRTLFFFLVSPMQKKVSQLFSLNVKKHTQVLLECFKVYLNCGIFWCSRNIFGIKSNDFAFNPRT